MTFDVAVPSIERRHRSSRAFDRVPGADRASFSVVATRQYLPDWSQPVAERLGHLLALRDGWTGAASARVERRLAELVLNDVLPIVMPDQGGPLPQIVPCVDGGLQLEWHVGGWNIEVTLSPLGDIWVSADAIQGDEDWEGTFRERGHDLQIALKTISS